MRTVIAENVKVGDTLTDREGKTYAVLGTICTETDYPYPHLRVGVRLPIVGTLWFDHDERLTCTED